MVSIDAVSAPGSRVLTRALATPGREDRLAHLEVIPARDGQRADWPQWLSPELVTHWESRGITRPWLHQVQAADTAREGGHVIMATGTASGKSLGYLMPALDTIARSRRRNGARGATVLYLSPTKALAQDQLAALRAVPGLAVSTCDGDSSREQRDWARDHAAFVLTNPDMLHRSLLPGHERWARFFSMLSYVVIDEAHYYRGVFGAHVAQVIRRLRRIATRYGASPTFVLASATAAEPAATAQRLTGLPFVAVTEDTSTRGETTLAFWEPPFQSFGGENAAPVRRSAAAESADLLTDLVIDNVRTLAFVRSRRSAEALAATSRRQLHEVAPELVGRVASYRGGYLPEERRELEQALRDGELIGLASTNALELGIDIAGLDAVVLAGYPGTRAALWQQIGRAGRAGTDALAVLVARDDPLDSYLVAHPESLLGQPVEAFVFDPGNPYVLAPHLCAAAAEIPVTHADLDLFGPTAPACLEDLVEAGLLRHRAHGWFWTDGRRASDLADIRGTGGAPVRLVEVGTGRLLGTVDASSAHGTAHPGAIYVHQGETYLVHELDLDDHVALVESADPDYSTFARDVTDIEILDEQEHQTWGRARLSFGEVQVTNQVVSFLRRRVPGGEVLGEERLDLPERHLRTKAVWWTIPAAALDDAGLGETALPGAAHAAEHAAIGLLPLFATCDRWDIGGVSTALHPDTGMLTVFVYDGHPGGAGFAERGFRTARAWLTATRDAISACRCDDGCPSCVQSPKCGNGNQPLDKHGAIELLDLLLGG